MLEERFKKEKGAIIHVVRAGKLTGSSSIRGRLNAKIPLAHQWWQHILRGKSPEVRKTGTITAVDLFCGSGGLSFGAARALEAVGLRHLPLLGMDVDGDALAVYARNFKPGGVLQKNVASVVDYHVYGRGKAAQLAYDPEIVDNTVSKLAGKVDLLLAGPPCQGHSNLNNHTRRSDPRNVLYVCTAALAIALRAKVIVIENVPDVVNDKTEVVETARTILRAKNYCVSDAILSATELGAAQTRRRHFLIASRNEHVSLETALKTLRQPAMTLREAIGDLETVSNPTFMDEQPMLSADNEERIEWLFDNDLWDLPDAKRPDCHKGGHTYPSVYGRMYWDKPAQTITTGFMTIGRGRYIHPSQRRVLTPREAARLQGFPDNFVFLPNGAIPAKTSLSKWIGDAVPTQLGYSATLAAISGY